MARPQPFRALLLLTVLLLVVTTGCGGDDDSEPVTTAASAQPAAVPQPSDADLAQAGLLVLADLGVNWASTGEPVPDLPSPCPVEATEALPATSRPRSQQFVATKAPTGQPTSAAQERVAIFPTLAEADAAYVAETAEERLTCRANLLRDAVESVTPEGTVVGSGMWTPFQWPEAGDRLDARAVTLTVAPPGAEAAPAAFATVVSQRGRAVSVVSIAWLNDETDTAALARSLQRAMGRLDGALDAPDARIA